MASTPQTLKPQTPNPETLNQVHGKLGRHIIDVEYNEKGERLALHPALYLIGKGTSVKFERIFVDPKSEMIKAVRTLSRFCLTKLSMLDYVEMKAVAAAEKIHESVPNPRP